MSPTTTLTCSNGTPTSSAAIWANVVSWPWPCGICDVNTDTMPSGSSRMRICSGPIIAAAAALVRGPGRGLDEGGDAEAEVPTFGTRRGLPRAERRQVDELGHALERLAGRDADEAAAR